MRSDTARRDARRAAFAAAHWPAYAERMGYKGPFRDPDEVREQCLEAEKLTAAIIEPYFSCLGAKELTRFGAAVEAASNVAAT